MSSNLKVITTKLPSYLQILLQDNFNIELIYQQISESGAQVHQVHKEQNDESSFSELELTGTPLTVDLGEDNSICTNADYIFIQPPSWSGEEENYYPVTLCEARSFINERLKLRKSNGNKPIIAICDGSDARHTAILGSSQVGGKLTRIVAYILPCCSEENEVTTLQYMKKEHTDMVNRCAQITYLVTKRYYLCAYDLRNCSSLSNNPNNGSVAVEVSSNQADTASQKNADIKIILQVVIGHPYSRIKSLWEELCLLQLFINILANGKEICETTVISEEPLDSKETISLIGDLLLHNVKHLKKEVNKSLDLQDLRDESIFDKLWNVLKKCHDALQLRDSVKCLFEELENLGDGLQNICSEENLVISGIITGILAGITPTLNFSQSLELLIDLGLEKLKKDYLVIIGSFYSFAEKIVSTKWRSFKPETPASTKGNAKRKFRSSINPNSVLTDVTTSRLKLSYLDSMHKVCEFILLSKDNLNLSEECFDYFCDNITNNFLKSEDQFVPQFGDIKKLRLCEFSLSSFPTDANIVKDCSPVAWTVTMVSALQYSETTTVFHFSDHPIFPPSAFNAYDISFNNTDSKTLYVTKLVKLVNSFGLFQ